MTRKNINNMAILTMIAAFLTLMIASIPTYASTIANVQVNAVFPGPKPNVIAQCPVTFGNTDIFLGTVS